MGERRRRNAKRGWARNDHFAFCAHKHTHARRLLEECGGGVRTTVRAERTRVQARTREATGRSPAAFAGARARHRFGPQSVVRGTRALLTHAFSLRTPLTVVAMAGSHFLPPYTLFSSFQRLPSCDFFLLATLKRVRCVSPQRYSSQAFFFSRRPLSTCRRNTVTGPESETFCPQPYDPCT